MTSFFLRVSTKVLGCIYNIKKNKPIDSRKITMISRESDEESLDFKLLCNELVKEDIHPMVLCKALKGKLSYIGHILTQIDHIATSKVVVIDTYCIPVSILKHKPETKIVQIWHSSAAIKKFGLQTIGKEDGTAAETAEIMHMHENYDYFIAPSKPTGAAFAEAFGYDEDRLKLLGLPRLQYLWESKSIERPSNEGKKTILYAPTFRKQWPVSIIDLAKELDFSKYDLIFSPHPLDNNDYEGILKTHGYEDRVIINRTDDTYDLIGKADILISDYSSMVVDASVMDIPIYIYAFDYEEYKGSTGLNVDFREEALGKYFFEGAANLAQSLEEPYDMEAVRAFRKKYIEIDYRRSTGELAQFLKTLMN